MSFNQRGALLTAVMLAALVAGASGAAQRLDPDWQRGYLVVVSFLVALEAGFVHYAGRTGRMSPGEMLRYLVPELFVMTVLMRIATTLGEPGAALAADLERWLYDPLSIFDPPFVLHMIAGLLVGLAAHLSMRDLSRLALQKGEGEAIDDERRFAMLMAADRASALHGLGVRFTVGAGLLLIALALETVNTVRLGGPPLPVSALSVIGALVYVASGFLLFSRARLALLQARWAQERASVAPTVEARWVRVSWLLIGGVIGLAALLPRSYAMGLLDTLRGALGVFGYLLALIGYGIAWLVALLLAVPGWLLSLLVPAGGPPPPPVVLPPSPPEPPPVERVPNLPAALLFWACMLLLAGYAAAIVLGRHPGLLRRLLSAGPLGRLWGWLATLWHDGSAWMSLASQQAAERLRRPPPPRGRPGERPLRLRRLPPREQVRYFYRSTLQRAAERGMARRAAQTPFEYRETLTGGLPEEQSDIGTLTDAYVAAQYAPRPVEQEDVARVRPPWERLRRALRSRPSARKG